MKKLCRVCGSSDIREFYTLKDYPMVASPVVVKGSFPIQTCDVVLVYCFGCGTCTAISPDPTEVEYGEGYTSSNLPISLGACTDDRVHALLDVVKDMGLKVGSKVLDIGCYDGSLMQMMMQRFGFDVYGCDPCSYVASIAVKKYREKVTVDYFSPSLYGRDYFDAVIFRNVLEHVPSPVQFLLDVKEVLKPNGHIVLEIPDGENRIANCVWGSVVPEHATYFGEDSLMNVLTCFKDSVVECYTGGIRAKAVKANNKDFKPFSANP